MSQLGSRAFDVAMILWIKDATGSASLMGLLLMVSSLPGVILGPIGGTFADRYPRRLIIVFSDLVDGVTILSLAALILVWPDATNVILVWMFAVSAVGAVTRSFFGPAITAAIPDMVPRDQLAGANGLIQASLQVTQFIGQGLGGMLYIVLGAPVLFLANAVTFLFSAASEWFISIPQKLPQRRSQERPAKSADIAPSASSNEDQEDAEGFKAFVAAGIEGLRYIWYRPGLRELIFGSAALAFFAVPFVVLLPFFIEDELNAGPEWYGLFLAALGAGAVVGSLLSGVIRLSGARGGRLLIMFVILQSSGYLLLGFLQTLTAVMVLAPIGGILSGIVGIKVMTIIQGSTPSEIRGRVLSLVTALSGSFSPIAMGLTGVIADLTGQNIRAIYVLCGSVLVLLSVLLGMNRNFRKFIANESDPESARATIDGSHPTAPSEWI